MAEHIECHIGRTSTTFNIPDAFKHDPLFIKNHLATGSRGAIQILLKNRVSEPSLAGDNHQLVDALDLHLSTQKLIGSTSKSKPTKIALILADKYLPRPDILGIMFDRGFPTQDDPNRSEVFTGTPREACAIFVGAITELRPNRIHFNREIEFTTTHELGHLFNLGHTSFPNSFMATSLHQASFPNDYFCFSEEQQAWLSECATNPLVHPGGSAFSPVTGAGFANEPYNNKPFAQLSLTIDITQKTFACLSPIELDVEIKETLPSGKVFYIPDKLDPGYEEFKIWIHHPDGEKRLFRSPRRYCSFGSKIKLDAGQKIHRDISIFEDCAGTVFSKPGLYQIQAEFNLGRRGLLTSNIITLEAIISTKIMTKERADIFSKSHIRNFLYHRSAKCGPNIIGELNEHLRIYPDGTGASAIRYALLRALSHAQNVSPKTYRTEVLRHLTQIEHGTDKLSARQNYHLRKIYNELTND
jgi:hypothetical protein